MDSIDRTAGLAEKDPRGISAEDSKRTTTPKDATHSTRDGPGDVGTRRTALVRPDPVPSSVSVGPRRGGVVSESAGERGGVQRRRKELGAGSGQDAAGLADQEGTLRYDDPRLQAHGTTTLFAALDVATGAVIGESYRRHRHQEVLRFLKKVEKAVPKEQELHIILDNYATHKHEEVLQWIERGSASFCISFPRVHPG